jgi:hypothetical protein
MRVTCCLSLSVALLLPLFMFSTSRNVSIGSVVVTDRALCAGAGPDGKLTYRKSLFHRVIPGVFRRCGAVCSRVSTAAFVACMVQAS